MCGSSPTSGKTGGQDIERDFVNVVQGVGTEYILVAKCWTEAAGISLIAICPSLKHCDGIWRNDNFLNKNITDTFLFTNTTQISSCDCFPSINTSNFLRSTTLFLTLRKLIQELSDQNCQQRTHSVYNLLTSYQNQ